MKLPWPITYGVMPAEEKAIFSGAVAYMVTGEKVHRDNAVKWMIAHCAEDVWGTGYGSNVDLHAAWYLY